MADGEETKVCSKCGRRLSLTAFYAHKRGILGRRPDCKRCHNTYRNGWARRRYVPKTGRRYFTKADRAVLATQEGRSV